jgi:hypothetical protein
MKPFLAGIIICLSIVGQPANGQNQNITSPKGTVITEGGCSSESCFARASIFFFEDGNCVRRDIDEGEDRITCFGTWKLEDSIIKIHYTVCFFGKPAGEKIYDETRCSEERYSLYTAVRENIDRHESMDWNPERQNIELITDKYSTYNNWRDYYGRETKRHIYQADFSQFNFLTTEIRIDRQRIFSEPYLASLSRQELRLLRNEIFAKYGLKFNSADLKEHFEKPLYYDGFYNDVTAFVNEYDRANIELVQKYESLSSNR